NPRPTAFAHPRRPGEPSRSRPQCSLLRRSTRRRTGVARVDARDENSAFRMESRHDMNRWRVRRSSHVTIPFMDPPLAVVLGARCLADAEYPGADRQNATDVATESRPKLSSVANSILSPLLAAVLWYACTYRYVRPSENAVHSSWATYR